MLRVCLFGGLSISWDDVPVATIASATARSLFAYLVIHRDRPQTRDLLAGTFWPDQPDTVARRRLSQALWHIRRALRQPSDADRPAPALLHSEGDIIQVSPDLPLWIDVEQFTGLGAKCANEHGAGTEPCESCIKLYQGDFLAGYYDDWILVEREQLRELFLVTLQRLVTGYKRQGKYEGALVFARRLAAEDPWQEESHREVMRLCTLLGRGSEALKQFETCREILASELGVEPSAETQVLANEIAAQDNAALPFLPVASRGSALALLERPDLLPLVGRHAERAALTQSLELAAAGRGGLILLAGEAGVGKTRLVQEVARDAAWRGFRVAWGTCCELCAPPPYQPLVEVLHGSDLSHLQAVWQRELARLLPHLSLPPTGDAPEHKHARLNSRNLAVNGLGDRSFVQEQDEERGLLLEALARAFVALGQASPHLVILEDVHWMDIASFEALRTLLPRLLASHLLLVCTLRPEDLAEQPAVRQSLASLESTRIPKRLDLETMTATEAGELIQRALQLQEPVPRFSHRLFSQTGGNPFFLTETLQVLVDQGLLYRGDGGAWNTPWDDATNDYSEMPVPPSVAHSVQQRLSLLAPATRNLLGIAAVAGRRVEFDVWLAAAELDSAVPAPAEEAVLAAAEELAQRGLLLEMDDVLGYRFAHDIIRQVVYEGLSAVRCRRWHRTVASALSMLHPDGVETLALHYRLGQEWSEAVHYTIRAGERAQAVYANQQALQHYRDAGGWLDQGRVKWPAQRIAETRAGLAERLGQVHSLVGEYREAEADYLRAWQTWVERGDWRAQARVLNRLSFLLFTQDDYVEASRYARLALAALPELESQGQNADDTAGLRATSLTHLGLSAWSERRYDDALPPLEQALAIFEQPGSDRYGLARCLNSLGLVHLERGELELADGCFARSLALRHQLGDRRGEAWCWHNQGRTALARGYLDDARVKLAAAQAMFADIEHPYGLEASARVLGLLEKAEATASRVGAAPTGAELEGAGGKTTARLPRSDAPTGRPLRDDEFVTITWTVSVQEDEAISGKAARRQHRLIRLLHEADTQCAAPTLDDLAAALGVSKATIKRDLAALRKAGHTVQTRGSRSS